MGEGEAVVEEGEGKEGGGGGGEGRREEEGGLADVLSLEGSAS